jgi:uncharacterized protein (TIGR02246 family)
MRSPSALAAAVLIFTACAAQSPSPPQADPAAVRASIESMNAATAAAIKSGDSAGMTANYASDAIVMMPNEPAWAGQIEIAAGFAGLASAGKMTQFDQTTDEVLVSGDVAVERGHIALTITPAKGKPMSDKVRYLTVWRKQANGTWKIARDMSHSEIPLSR